MNALFSRRKLITAGIVTAAGAAGGAALSHRWLANHALIPPDGRSLLGAGETLTYSAQRLLTSEQSLARESPRSRISKVAPVSRRRQ
jgi:hypothetical protein